MGGKTQPGDHQQHEQVDGDKEDELIAGKRATHKGIVP